MMMLMSKIRQAAKDSAFLSFAYGGGDAVELIALVRAIGDREDCSIDYTVASSSPGVITVRFVRKAEA